MSRAFEELDRQSTPLGELVLRRRLEPSLHVDVWEVKLGDEFLMSSLFTAAEEQLAHLAIDALPTADAPFDVAVGGLGLGYTAGAALAHGEVRRLDVIDVLAPVIDWHVRGLVPLGPSLHDDERCHLHHEDFFARAGDPAPLVPQGPLDYDAILLDIDHTPSHHLHDDHVAFYTAPALGALADHLRPQGVFAMWSDGTPDESFVAVLDTTFDEVTPHVVEFANPIAGGTSASTVYVARRV